MHGNSISLSSDGNIIAIGDQQGTSILKMEALIAIKDLYKYLNGKMVHGHNLAVILFVEEFRQPRQVSFTLKRRKKHCCDWLRRK